LDVAKKVGSKLVKAAKSPVAAVVINALGDEDGLGELYDAARLSDAAATRAEE
jgi:hypothetical protein